VSRIDPLRQSFGLMVLRISNDKHIIIVAQDAATYKVMDLFDARCKDLIDG